MAGKYHQASTAAEEEIINENKPTVVDEYDDSDDETNDEIEITMKRAKSALSNLEHQGSTPQQQQKKAQKA